MQTKILIAGAGPTGLMAGCQLRRFGIDCLIIDKKSEPTKESRALAVQSRTLEIYEQMSIAGDAVTGGQVIEFTNIIIKGKIGRTLPIGELGKGLSPFPFILVYEQNKNEELLLEYYLKHGGRILWDSELLGVSQDDKKVSAVIRQKVQGEETITADYLIGADGAKSVVRHSLGFEFKGETYENIFFVADTQVEWNFGYEQLYFNLTGNTFSGMFGMKGHHRFRLIGILPKEVKDEHNVTFDDIKETVEKHWGMPIHFTTTDWFSIYRLHHRRVNKFSEGRVFLCGDSAHIHSPVGGQGMNTGLQDAYNLCWKLAMVVKGVSSAKLLDTYNEERLPFAERLVQTTDRIFSFISSENFFIRFLRVRMVPVMTWLALQFNFSRRLIYMTVSQIGINYRKSPLSSGGGGKVKAGDRVPYAEIYDDVQKKMISIYDKLKEPCFHLLVFGNADEKFVRDVEAIQDGLVKVVSVVNSIENKNVYKIFGVNERSYVLVRPDNYIAKIRQSSNANEIEGYLKEIF